MPVIACPGCGKKYNLPESAAGQVATCKCGKRFKVGASAPKEGSAPVAAVKRSSVASSAAAAASQAKTVSKSKPPAVAKAAPTANAAEIAADDDFWDEGLKTVTVAKEPAPLPPAAPKPAEKFATASGKKKPPKEKRVRWGFDWGRVVAGGLSFLLFGGLTAALLITTGRISIYLAFAAAAGLFTALSGLMGEEGIW
jgi:hypothetical protein